MVTRHKLVFLVDIPSKALAFSLMTGSSKVVVSASGHCCIYLVILKSLFPKFLFISLVSQTRKEVLVCSLQRLENPSKTSKHMVRESVRGSADSKVETKVPEHTSHSGGGCHFHGCQHTTRDRKEVVKSGEEGIFV